MSRHMVDESQRTDDLPLGTLGSDMNTTYGHGDLNPKKGIVNDGESRLFPVLILVLLLVLIAISYLIYQR